MDSLELVDDEYDKLQYVSPVSVTIYNAKTNCFRTYYDDDDAWWKCSQARACQWSYAKWKAIFHQNFLSTF